jgi:hypothetical protein
MDQGFRLPPLIIGSEIIARVWRFLLGMGPDDEAIAVASSIGWAPAAIS